MVTTKREIRKTRSFTFLECGVTLQEAHLLNNTRDHHDDHNSNSMPKALEVHSKREKKTQKRNRKEKGEENGLMMNFLPWQATSFMVLGSLVGWNSRLPRLCITRKTIGSLQLDSIRLTKRLDWDVHFAALRGFAFYQPDPSATSSPGVDIAGHEHLQADEDGENESERNDLHRWRFLCWPDKERMGSDVGCSWLNRLETSEVAFWQKTDFFSFIRTFVVCTVDVSRRGRHLVVGKSWFPHR